MTVSRRFAVLTFLRWFPTGLQIPALILLLTARGLSLPSVGAVVLAYGLTCAVLELPTGGLADVLGPRAVLVASGLLFVGSAVVVAFGRDPVTLTAGAALGGAARALDSGPLEAWFVDTLRSADPRADLKPGLSRAHAAGAVGIGLGSLAGGGLITVAPLDGSGGSALLSLSVPYLASAALGLVSSVMVLAWVRDLRRAGPRPRIQELLLDVPRTVARGTALVTRSPVLRRLSARIVVIGVVLLTCELLSPLQFGASMGPGGYAVLVTLAFGGTALGAALGPLVARRLGGSERGLLVTTALSGAAMAGLALPGRWWPAVAYVLLYTALGTQQPAVGELLHDETSAAERSTVLSVQSLLMQGGGAMTVLSVPLVARTTSFEVVWLGAAALLALTALLAVGLGGARSPGPGAQRWISGTARTAASRSGRAAVPGSRR